MSIMDGLFESKFFVCLVFVVGLFAMPLLFLVPIVFVVLCWEAIQTIEDPVWRYYIYFCISLISLAALLVRTTKINAYLRKKLGITYLHED